MQNTIRYFSSTIFSAFSGGHLRYAGRSLWRKALSTVSCLGMGLVVGVPVFAEESFSTSGTLPAGEWTYETIEVPAESEGLRVVISSEDGDPELYLREGENPTESEYDYAGSSFSKETFTSTILVPADELSEGTWHIGAYNPDSQSLEYSLSAKEAPASIELDWDEGDGSNAFEVTDSDGGKYKFTIATRETQLGAWRQSLAVESGKAQLFVREHDPAAPDNYDLGSDLNEFGAGWVLPLDTENVSGTIWHITVAVEPGSDWSLVSGDVPVIDLGELAEDASSGSEAYDNADPDIPAGVIPPEGVRFFRTTLPQGTRAWRLWLQTEDGSDTWMRLFDLRAGQVPTPDSNGDWDSFSAYDEFRAEGQNLLVPPEIEAGEGVNYYVAVIADAGESFRLDSRQQPVTDVDFDDETTVVYGGDGSWFHTFRIADVPDDILGWEVTSLQESGDPFIAARRDEVASHRYSDAFSEVEDEVNNSFTFIPPELSDGTYFVTVYGSDDFTFRLRNGVPEVTTIDFESSTANDEPDRAGWRYYQMPESEDQVRALGWMLDLADHAPDTRIAIRRNDLPGSINYRTGGGSSTTTHVLEEGEHGYLQRPEHESDFYYIGVYTEEAALGNFVLESGAVEPPEVDLETPATEVEGLRPGEWAYFKFELPDTYDGHEVLGWELRSSRISGSLNGMLLRRDQLPKNTFSSSGIGSRTSWGSGDSSFSTLDWTRRQQTADGSTGGMERVISFGMGQPLEPGTYYMGVQADIWIDDPATFSWQSRLIGAEGSGFAYEIGELDYDGGVSSESLDPREVAYYTVEIGENVSSWRLRLDLPDEHEAHMVLRKDYLPSLEVQDTELWSNIYDPLGSIDDPSRDGRHVRLSRDGSEFYDLWPEEGEDYVEPGEYYILVVSEGQNPEGASQIGEGEVDYTLTSVGEVPVMDLGTVDAGEEIFESNRSFANGIDRNYYTVEVPAGALGVRIGIEDVQGAPEAGVIEGMVPPAMSNYGTYNTRSVEWSGEQRIYVSNPEPGPLSIAVHADVVESDEYSLRVEGIEAETVPIDDFETTVEGLSPGEWTFYEVEVPDDGTFRGWEVFVQDWEGDSQPTITIGYEHIATSTSNEGWPPTIATGPARASFTTSRSVAGSGANWTGLPEGLDGRDPEAYRITLAEERPLVPGTYYVGFKADESDAEAISFDWTSRAVGDYESGYYYEIFPIDFGRPAGGQIDPREVHYYLFEVEEEDELTNVRFNLELSGEDEGDDAQLYIREGWIPNTYGQSTSAADPAQATEPHQVRLNKEGNDQFVLWPRNQAEYVQEGIYYLMVVGEGQNPDRDEGIIGEGSVNYSLSAEEVAPDHLGVLDVEDPIVETGSYEPGEVRYYQFDLPEGVESLQVRLEDTDGDPLMTLREGEFPSRMYSSYYGHFSGYSTAFERRDSSLITIADPDAGTYNVMVAHGGGTEANPSVAEGSYTLRVEATGAVEIPMDGYSDSVSDLGAGEWAYYVVEVPETIEGEEVLGWEVRVTDWSGEGPPLMAINRGSVPPGTTTISSAGSWDEDGQWMSTQAHNWTERDFSADGSVEYEQIVIATAMRRPLEPGTFYIGFENTADSGSVSFDWTSRAIGPEDSGMSYEADLIDFEDGSTSGSLDPREIAVYAVDIPEETPSWKVELDVEDGHEALLYLRREYVADTRSNRTATGNPDGSLVQMDTPGNQHFATWPSRHDEYLEPGRYYLTVASAGQSPSDNNWIGTGAVEYTLRSYGEVDVHDLGTVAAGVELTETDRSYDSSEVHYYRFQVPEGLPALELQLFDRDGSPTISLHRDEIAPGAERWGSTLGLTSGNYSGRSPEWQSQDFLTLGNPEAGVYTMAVAHGIVSGTGGYSLRVRGIEPAALDFAAAADTVSGEVGEGQSSFYQTEVGTEVDVGEGAESQMEDVIGWRLRLQTSEGEAEARVRFGETPQGGDFENDQTRWQQGSLLIAPPNIEPGEWFVEVRGVTAAEYTLESQAITLDSLEREIWEMPARDEVSDAPGLDDAVFGDSGIDAAGEPLQDDDQGVDLSNGDYHLYAIDVPENNGGLLRTLLESISGEAELYVRPAYLPTVTHNEEGDGLGPLTLHRLTGSSETQRGSWVPYHVLEDERLETGLWFLKVYAGGDTSARYRLTLSHHNKPLVKSLAADGGNHESESLNAGDWRYYRVTFPENPEDMPAEWTVDFDREQGSLEMYLRDSAPPGFWENTGINSHTNPRDWDTEDLIVGPNQRSYDEGVHTFDGTFLRPGKTYYLGFLADSDAVFSVSSDISVETIEPIYGSSFDVLEGTGGMLDVELDPDEVRTWRVDFPAEARRWRVQAENSSEVDVYVGRHAFLPDFSGTVSNFLESEGVEDWQEDRLIIPSSHRDFPNTFYMTVENTSSEPQAFSQFLDWRQDDEFNISLDIVGGGSVEIDPEDYTSGDTIELAATADLGWTFSEWTGDVESTENPLSLTPFEELEITAVFEEFEGIYIAEAEVLTEHLIVGDGPGDEVEVEVTIVNTGDSADSITPELSFSVEDFDPVDPADWEGIAPLGSVEVNAGETEVVTLTYNMEDVTIFDTGAYYNVEVNGIDAGSFVGMYLYSYMYAGYYAGEILAGETEVVSFYLYGPPDEDLEVTVPLAVDGDTVDDMTLTAPEGTWVGYESFEYAFSEPGDRTVTVANIESDGSPITVLDPAEVQGEVEITSVTAPSEVNVGETFTVRVDLEETEGEHDTSIELELSFNGDIVDTETVVVDAGDTAVAELTHTFSTDGTYTGDVNGESFSIDALLPDLELEFSNLQVGSTNVYSGNFIRVTAEVENLDSLAGEFEAEFSVVDPEGTFDGEPSEVHEDTYVGWLEAEESKTLSFYFYADGGLDYEAQVSVDRLDPLTVEIAPAWSQFGYGHGNRGIGNPVSGPSVPVDILWEYDIEGTSEDAVDSSPVVADGVVYFGSSLALVHAVDVETGDPVWADEFEADGPVTTSPAIADGRVFVTTSGEGQASLHAIDASEGSELWTVDGIADAALTDPIVAEDHVFVGSDEGSLHAYDVETGSEAWPEYEAGDAIVATPAYVEGILYFGTYNDDGSGAIHAVDAWTGTSAWESPYETDSIDSSPAMEQVFGLEGWTLYVGNSAEELLALNAESGEMIWDGSYALGGSVSGSPMVAGPNVFAVTTSGEVHKIDAVSGDAIWDTPASVGSAVSLNPVYANSWIYLGTLEGQIMVLPGSPDEAPAATVWDWDIGAPLKASPVVFQGQVYVGAGDGNLYAFHTIEDQEPGDPEAPSIVSQPQSISVFAGDPAGFFVEFGGEPPFEFVWEFGEVVLEGEDEAFIQLDDVSLDDTGSYRVTISNEHGEVTSDPATLDVYSTYLMDTDFPESLVAEQETDFQFTLETDDEGTTGFDATWIRFEIDGPGEAAIIVPGDEAPEAIPAGEVVGPPSGLPLPAQVDEVLDWEIVFSEPGEYTVTLELFTEFEMMGEPDPRPEPGNGEVIPVSDNGDDTETVEVSLASSSDTLTVEEPSLPFIVEQPESVIAQLEQGVEFTVEAGGDSPLSYQWFHDEEALDGATDSTLNIPAASIEFTGSYTVEVSNAFGEVLSDSAQLDLRAPYSMDVNYSEQVLSNEDIDVFVDLYAAGEGTVGYEAVRFQVSADGPGEVTFVATDPEGNTETVHDDGEWGPEDGFPLAADHDESYEWILHFSETGEYTIGFEVFNVLESGELGEQLIAFSVDTVEVETLPPPEIVEQPQDVTVSHGEGFSLDVTASGDGDLQYRWYRSDQPVTEWRSITSYSISSSSSSHAGSYYVVVETEYGSVQSDTVSVQVEIPPELPEGVSDAEVEEVDEETGRTRYNSDWLGVFYAIEGSAGWIYSERIGWVYVWPGQASGSMWFWDPLADLIFFTDEEIHPFVYSEKVGFAVYARGGEDRRYLHVLSDDEIIDLDLEGEEPEL
ncbi:MAG: PQQ-binding-like beta-propeller repeat protein [Opitutales bacterium]|nr:PQQ-binding-like beta-propeller repeat protein [Opitutales bacterium]